MTKRRLSRVAPLFLAAAIGIGATSSCLNYRVTVLEGDPQQIATESETRNLFLWGQVGNRAVNVSCEKSHAVYEVEVSTTFWQGLATALTLGIWSPATVEWRCATVSKTKGKIPIPGGKKDDEDKD